MSAALTDATCPGCQQQLDNLEPHEDYGRGPGPGDMVLCLHCGSPLVITPADTLAMITPEVVATMDDEERRVLTVVRAAITARRRLLS